MYLPNKMHYTYILTQQRSMPYYTPPSYIAPSHTCCTVRSHIAGSICTWRNPTLDDLSIKDSTSLHEYQHISGTVVHQ